MVTDLMTKDKSLPFPLRIRERAAAVGTWMCIGIDPDPAYLPPSISRDTSGIIRFCRDIVDATCDLALAYKINFAFFEVLGPPGWKALEEVRSFIPESVPVIADAKRGDIANSSAAYARSILDVLGFDAVTVSPYLGCDSLAPFLDYPDKGVFVLCKTSNSGATDLQDLPVDGKPLFLHIAKLVLSLPAAASAGLVVGATQLDALKAVRALNDDVLILAPGVGAQGARAAEALQAGGNSRGENTLISVSREVLFASDRRDYASAARAVALRFADECRLRLPT